MLRITESQIEVFNEPYRMAQEEQIIAFVQSRPELKEAGDAEFLRAACLQLIPRGRTNGLKTANELCRYLYLSLCLDYRATGQDVCQRMEVPYSSAGLRKAHATLIDLSAKAGNT
jgi:hypothetical protein